MTGWIIGIGLAVLLVLWLKRNVSASASMVVTGPGVLKIHDVECRFRSDAGFHGKLSQSRWSDGQERFRLNLRNLPGAYSGVVVMYRQGSSIAEFDAKGGRVSFATKGVTGSETPKLEIGEELVLQFGGRSLSGIVEAD